MSKKNKLTLSGIEPATFRFVAQHLNHCASAVPLYIYIYIYIYVCVYEERERERETTFLNHDSFDNKHDLFQLQPAVFCVIRKTLRKQDLCQSSRINAATWF